MNRADELKKQAQTEDTILHGVLYVFTEEELEEYDKARNDEKLIASKERGICLIMGPDSNAALMAELKRLCNETGPIFIVSESNSQPARPTDVESMGLEIRSYHEDLIEMVACQKEIMYDIAGVPERYRNNSVKLPAKPFIPKKRGSRVTYKR